MQLHSRTGKFQRPKVDIQLGKDVAFRQGPLSQGGGVQGEEDVGDSIDADEEAEKAGRRREEVELTRHVELRTSVRVDARVEYAANAFEYDFDGESVVRVPEVPDVGPSPSACSWARPAAASPLRALGWLRSCRLHDDRVDVIDGDGFTIEVITNGDFSSVPNLDSVQKPFCLNGEHLYIELW